MAEISVTDPNVKIPPAVARAAARAAAMQEAVYKTDPAPETPPAEPEVKADAAPPAPETPPAEPAVEPEVKADAAPPAPPAEPEKVDWEARSKSLQGRVAPLQRENADLRAHIERMQSQIDLLSEAQEAEPDTPASYLTDDDRDLVGDDVLDVIGRKTQEQLAPYEKKISGLLAQVDKLQGLLSGVTQTTQRQTEENIYTTLDREAPTWKELNRNEDFLQWLDLRDPFSGAMRKELLTDAFTAGDASRVVSFFKGFQSDQAAIRPAVPASPTPAAPAPGSQDKLMQYAAPGRARATADANPASPEHTPTFTRADIAAYYADVQRGRYKGRDEQKQRLEAQIFEAQSKGLIQG